MRRLRLVLAALCVSSAVAAESTAFINVNVIAMTDESVLAQQTVIVRDGAIVQIGHVDEVPLP